MDSKLHICRDFFFPLLQHAVEITTLFHSVYLYQHGWLCITAANHAKRVKCGVVQLKQ